MPAPIRFLAALFASIAVLSAFSCQDPAPLPSPPPAPPADVPGEGLEPPEDSTVLVTEDGRVCVFEGGATRPSRVHYLGDEVHVRSVVAAPRGRGFLVLLEEWAKPKPESAGAPLVLGVLRALAGSTDFSSRIVWMDPWAGESRLLFDSYRDRWDGEGNLEAAVEEAGEAEARVVDNDVVDLFAGRDGRLYFRTESDRVYLLDLEGGALRRLSLAEPPLERMPARRWRKIGGLSGWAFPR